MPLSHIIKWLDEEFAPKLNTIGQTNFANLIKEANLGHRDIDRVVGCLAIDLKCHHVYEQTYIWVFENWINRHSSKLVQLEDTFSDLIVKVKNGIVSLPLYSQHNSESDTRQHEFCKLTSFSSFFVYCVNKYTSVHYVGPHDTIEGIQNLEDGLYNGITFRNSSERPRECVWVTTKEEVDTIIMDKSIANHDKVKYICGCLGLIIDFSHSTESDKHFVRVLYPRIAHRTYHPLTINRNVGKTDDLYMSYKHCSENFGRTRPSTGDDSRRRRKERIHETFDGGTYNYNCEYLGKLNGYDLNIDTIIDETILRFNEI